MKIIFLDIDGVLNSTEYFRNAPDSYLFSDPEINLDNYQTRVQEWSKDIDEKAVKVLNKIIEKTGAKIVLSSAWRNSRWEEIEDILNLKGFEYLPLLDRTPTLDWDSSVRGNEILFWIKHNAQYVQEPHYKYKNYLILDDSTDMLLWQKDNFHYIDGEIGLQESDIEPCIMILNKE